MRPRLTTCKPSSRGRLDVETPIANIAVEDLPSRHGPGRKANETLNSENLACMVPLDT